MESSGWRAVAEAFEVEAGPGFAIQFLAESAEDAPRRLQDPGIDLAVPGLGTWTVHVPEGPDRALAPSVPLRESLAFALRLAEGLPPILSELEAVLDPLPYAALLLDGEARLLFANTWGEDLLSSRRLARPARLGAHLKPARRRAEEALDTALARILHENDPGSQWIMRGPGGTRLVVRARSVGPVRPDRGAARILLTLRAIGAAIGAHG